MAGTGPLLTPIKVQVLPKGQDQKTQAETTHNRELEERQQRTRRKAAENRISVTIGPALAVQPHSCRRQLRRDMVLNITELKYLFQQDVLSEIFAN